MRVCGIICEYNPFHLGHAHHLREARRASGADYLLCVMSGSLTQRGVFARHDKWTRAQMALEGGADLVLELPVRFACAPAPDFAHGAVTLLSALGAVTHLSFGCEAAALPLLFEASRALCSEDDAFRGALHAGLARGLSHPRARAQALAACGQADLAAAIALPNASLACEYLRALPPHITPVPIERAGSGYHDAALSPLPSASAVRRALERGNEDAALRAVYSPHLLAQAEARGDVHEAEALTQALLYRLRTESPEALSHIRGMDEGLQNRLIDAARTCITRETLLTTVKTRRYTHARLSRLCADVLLGITRDTAKAHAVPTYARVLGFRRESVPLLHAIKAKSTLPLWVKAARGDMHDPLFALDLLAQDLWSLGCTAPSLRQSGRDLRQSPVML